MSIMDCFEFSSLSFNLKRSMERRYWYEWWEAKTAVEQLPVKVFQNSKRNVQNTIPIIIFDKYVRNTIPIIIFNF